MQRLIRYGTRWTSRLNKFHPKIKEQPLAPSFTSVRTSSAGNESQLGQSSSRPPIQVGFTESAGRGVFATRRIEAGELIHTAKPIISHPSLPYLHSVCYFCLKKLPNIIPSQIDDGVVFCSEECRKQSEDFRKVEKKENWSNFNEHCLYANFYFYFSLSLNFVAFYEF